MSINNLTYQPLQSISIKASEDIPANRFVSFSGGICPNETKAIGVTPLAIYSDEYTAIISLGTVSIQSSETISIGDNVTSDADGKAKIAESGMVINGRALTACSGAGYIKLQIVQ